MNQSSIDNIIDQQIEQSWKLGPICYPFYAMLIVISTLAISINQKRFKKVFKFDSIFLFMVIYIGNFIFTSIYFKSMNKYFRIGLPTVLMFVVVWICGKFQIIGLTGNIACGKSVVSNYFKNHLRIGVIDCDLLARKVVEPGKPAYKKIVQIFGDSILKIDSKDIDRKVLGDIVFSNSTKRSQLTQITGFYIFLEIVKEIYVHCFKNKEQIIILDAPLLFESKYLQYLCYPICVVYISDERVQLQRLMERDQIDEELAMKKIKSQMSQQKKMERADILLSNDKKPEDLIKQVAKHLPEFVF